MELIVSLLNNNKNSFVCSEGERPSLLWVRFNSNFSPTLTRQNSRPTQPVVSLTFFGYPFQGLTFSTAVSPRHVGCLPGGKKERSSALKSKQDRIFGQVVVHTEFWPSAISRTRTLLYVSNKSREWINLRYLRRIAITKHDWQRAINCDLSKIRIRITLVVEFCEFIWDFWARNNGISHIIINLTSSNLIARFSICAVNTNSLFPSFIARSFENIVGRRCGTMIE